MNSMSHKISIPMNSGVRFSIFSQNSVMGRKQRKSRAAAQEKSLQYQGKVLLAEDNEINQILFHEILSQYGIAPHIVSNGEEAIKKILAYRFDLIFLDINMPVMDGLQALKIAKMLGTPAPIIAHTANVMEEGMVSTNGFDGYLAKPIFREDFERILSKHLSPIDSQNHTEGRGQ